MVNRSVNSGSDLGKNVGLTDREKDMSCRTIVFYSRSPHGCRAHCFKFGRWEMGRPRQTDFHLAKVWTLGCWSSHRNSMFLDGEETQPLRSILSFFSDLRAVQSSNRHLAVVSEF